MPSVASPGTDFSAPVYRNGFGIVAYNTANTAIVPNVPVAAYAAQDHAVDYNVTQLGGVLPLGAGDGAEFMFILGGTVTTPTFLLTALYPYPGADGNIAGYIELPLVDAAAGFSASSLAVGTVLGDTTTPTAMTNVDGTAATSAISSTAVWGKAIVAASNLVSLSGVTFANNCDLVQVTGEFASRLRVTPAEGATHLRMQMKTGGGSSPKMWCIGRRTRGGAMRG